MSEAQWLYIQIYKTNPALFILQGQNSVPTRQVPFLRPLFTTHSDRTCNHTVPGLSLVRFPYPSAPMSIRITISAGIFFCKGKVILHHTGTPYFGSPFIL